MSDLTEDHVYHIASNVINAHEQIDLARYEELKKGRDENRSILAAQNVILGKIEIKVDAMYGNGSSRKGILDEIKEDQKELAGELKTSQKEIKEALIQYQKEIKRSSRHIRRKNCFFQAYYARCF
jgi:hypothetical protein